MNLELQAPAKVNLYFHIIARRTDGYHEVVTRLQKLELYDTVSLALTERKGIVLSCSDDTLPTDAKNLAVQAAQRFLALSEPDYTGGVSIELDKRIPVSAGLGGGSSDAGAVLRGLQRLFDNPVSEEQLHQLARELGADVPFFCSPHSAAIGTGRGDKLKPVPNLSDFWFLLVKPSFGVSTKWAFENYALTRQAKNSTLAGFQYTGSGGFSVDELHNDLESITAREYPVIDAIKQALLAQGAAGTLMSGSGPTVFGLFTDDMVEQRSPQALTAYFVERYGDRVYLTRTVAGA